MQQQLDERRSVEKLIPETYTDSLTASRRPSDGKPDSTNSDKFTGLSYTTMRTDDGRAMRLVVPRGFGDSDTMAERQIETREGWSWKDDIRDRVDIAMRVSKALSISHRSSPNLASRSTTTVTVTSSITIQVTPKPEKSKAQRWASSIPQYR